MREFISDDELGFSSFAELIGLTRGIGLAMIPNRNSTDHTQHSSMVANFDTSIAAWYSLLPPSRRDLIQCDGSLDELMCKANFILHAYDDSIFPIFVDNLTSLGIRLRFIADYPLWHTHRLKPYVSALLRPQRRPYVDAKPSKLRLTPSSVSRPLSG